MFELLKGANVMKKKQIINALFIQQRNQIISMRLCNSGLFSDAYTYAWLKGLDPYLDDSDGTVVPKPHENFSKQFLIKRKFARDVINYLDNGQRKDFYTLEENFGGSGSRIDLVSVCRYAYMKDMFEESLWDSLLNRAPSEANSLKDKLDERELMEIC